MDQATVLNQATTPKTQVTADHNRDPPGEVLLVGEEPEQDNKAHAPIITHHLVIQIHLLVLVNVLHQVTLNLIEWIGGWTVAWTEWTDLWTGAWTGQVNMLGREVPQEDSQLGQQVVQATTRWTEIGMGTVVRETSCQLTDHWIGPEIDHLIDQVAVEVVVVGVAWTMVRLTVVMDDVIVH